MNKKDFGDFVRGIIGIAVIGVVGYAWLKSGDQAAATETSKVLVTEEQSVAPKPSAQEVAEQERVLRYAHNCLSVWDGSHPAFERNVAAMLNDPNSIDHVETVTWPRREDGRSSIMMTFRAANGFGGTVTAKARGSINSEDCSDAIVDEIIQ